MQNAELTIFVGELVGIPRVGLSGSVNRWHEQAVLGIMNGFREQGTSYLVLDIDNVASTDMDTVTTIVNILRKLDAGFCVHVVASGAFNVLLKKAGLGGNIRLYSSLDEISEHVIPEREYLTSRWMTPRDDDFELPMVA